MLGICISPLRNERILQTNNQRFYKLKSLCGHSSNRWKWWRDVRKAWNKYAKNSWTKPIIQLITNHPHLLNRWSKDTLALRERNCPSNIVIICYFLETRFGIIPLHMTAHLRYHMDKLISWICKLSFQNEKRRGKIRRRRENNFSDCFLHLNINCIDWWAKVSHFNVRENRIVDDEQNRSVKE